MKATKKEKEKAASHIFWFRRHIDEIKAQAEKLGTSPGDDRGRLNVIRDHTLAAIEDYAVLFGLDAFSRNLVEVKPDGKRKAVPRVSRRKAEG